MLSRFLHWECFQNSHKIFFKIIKVELKNIFVTEHYSLRFNFDLQFINRNQTLLKSNPFELLKYYIIHFQDLFLIPHWFFPQCDDQVEEQQWGNASVLPLLPDLHFALHLVGLLGNPATDLFETHQRMEWSNWKEEWRGMWCLCL